MKPAIIEFILFLESYSKSLPRTIASLYSFLRKLMRCEDVKVPVKKFSVGFVLTPKGETWIFYLGFHLFKCLSIFPSFHHRSYALEKLTNRKRRLLFDSEGNSHGISQQLTMELASLVFLQFEHGMKMANTLWLCGGADH